MTGRGWDEKYLKCNIISFRNSCLLTSSSWPRVLMSLLVVCGRIAAQSRELCDGHILTITFASPTIRVSLISANHHQRVSRSLEGKLSIEMQHLLHITSSGISNSQQETLRWQSWNRTSKCEPRRSCCWNHHYRCRSPQPNDRVQYHLQFCCSMWITLYILQYMNRL